MFGLFEIVGLTKTRAFNTFAFTNVADAIGYFKPENVLDQEVEGDDFANLAVNVNGALRVFTVEAL